MGLPLGCRSVLFVLEHQGPNSIEKNPTEKPLEKPTETPLEIPYT